MDMVPFDDEVPKGYKHMVKARVNQIHQEWLKETLWEININCTISGLKAEPWICYYPMLRVVPLIYGQDAIYQDLIKDKMRKFSKIGKLLASGYVRKESKKNDIMITMLIMKYLKFVPTVYKVKNFCKLNYHQNGKPFWIENGLDINKELHKSRFGNLDTYETRWD